MSSSWEDCAAPTLGTPGSASHPAGRPEPNARNPPGVTFITWSLVSPSGVGDVGVGPAPRLHHQPAGFARAAEGMEGGDGRVQPRARQIQARPQHLCLHLAFLCCRRGYISLTAKGEICGVSVSLCVQVATSKSIR